MWSADKYTIGSPKTEHARAFMQQYGTDFDVMANPFQQGHILVTSHKTGETLMCRMVKGTPCINGKLIRW